MERIIKFRVWDKKKNRFLQPKPKDCPVLIGDFVDSGGLTIFLSIDTTPLGDSFLNSGEIKSEDFIFQQFVGLYDINKKEIYEDDILVQYPPSRPRILIEENIYAINYDLLKLPLQDVVIRSGTVEFDPPNFFLNYLKTSERGACAGSLSWDDNYEIIGNIFENSELLEKEFSE